jgi:hypothetical protein
VQPRRRTTVVVYGGRCFTRSRAPRPQTVSTRVALRRFRQAIWYEAEYGRFCCPTLSGNGRCLPVPRYCPPSTACGRIRSLAPRPSMSGRCASELHWSIGCSRSTRSRATNTCTSTRRLGLLSYVSDTRSDTYEAGDAGSRHGGRVGDSRGWRQRGQRRRAARSIVSPLVLLVAVAVDVVALVDDGRAADADVVLVVITSEARCPTGQTAPNPIGCGPAIALTLLSLPTYRGRDHVPV